MEDKRREEKPSGVEPVITPRSGERQHGKLYRWLDNFWYHHKWAVIVTLFIAVVLTVCIVQMATREGDGDVSVVAAGPYGFMTDEAGLTSLQQCLATYLPADYDENGAKEVRVYSFPVFSEAEAEALANRTDENGNNLGLSVDGYANTQEYQRFSQYITTGEAAVMLLSPWLFEELTGRSDCLVDVASLVDGGVPANAIATQKADGSIGYYGIRLCETKLWRDNSAIRGKLPEDTVLCLMMPTLLGDNADEEHYNKSVEYFGILMQ